jgi:transposase
MKPSKEEFTLYYSNNTRKDTACHFNVSDGVVRYWIKEFKCGKDRTKPRPDKEEFCQQFISKTNKELALHYDVPERRIQHWAKEWKLHRELKKVSKDELLNFYKENTLEDTARRFAVSASYAAQLARKYGFKKNKDMIKISLSIPLPEDVESFKEFHLTHPCRETAKHYNVCNRTITRWCRQLNIERKTNQQINVYKTKVGGPLTCKKNTN